MDQVTIISGASIHNEQIYAADSCVLTMYYELGLERPYQHEYTIR
jgi:hypothetical protein